MKRFLIVVLLVAIGCGGKSITIQEPILATYNCNVVVTENYAYYVVEGKAIRQLNKIDSCLYGDIKEQESHSRYFRIKADGMGTSYGSDIMRGCKIIGENPFNECE